ncbi:hypothetical protein GCT13_39865 [Paraburkholderia sp. CNPSo 3157]|uniref:Uncharacterized protein n=1 Tax=Paraburkholderia franconis TaxID=2654983 RepID=A0A7X1TKK3_9BURK|nr:hypothetical protein [Paraburkholderia franconis]MPW22797.1 hypothetical protein [Paraburkholderia franconis]
MNIEFCVSRLSRGDCFAVPSMLPEPVMKSVARVAWPCEEISERAMPFALSYDKNDSIKDAGFMHYFHPVSSPLLL